MEATNIKAIIFDMDGVIFDTERLVIENWKTAAKEYGIDQDEIEKVCYSCIGTNMVETKKIVLDHYGQDFPYDEFRAKSSGIFKEKAKKYGIPQKKGVRELLSFLKERDVLIGLASSTRIEVVTEELTDGKLIDFFDVLVGGNMVEHSKPEPDVFLKCMELLEVRPTQVIIIEDSFNGIRAAKKAGATAYMVPDILGPNEEMLHLSDKIFENLDEVRSYLNTFLN